MISFNIRQWRAWAPGLESAADWQGWSSDARLPGPLDALADVSFLPAMQRRRLGRLARMTFSVGWPLAEGLQDLPLVFVSRHGETPRTFDILSDLAQQQPLSPTQFSLSVHNAVIGLWSILRNETSEMTALAAAGDGFEQGLLEAAGLLHEGAPAVLLVIAEEQPPAAYREAIADVPFSYALGLLLTPGSDWQLSLAARPADATPADLPHALSWLRQHLRGQTTFNHTWSHRTWTWQSQ